MKFHPNFKNFNFFLNLIDVYQYHTLKKIHPRITLTTLLLKYKFKFSNYVTCIIWSQTYFIHSNFSMFVEIFKIID
jgi:hypothetical protein